MLLCGESYIQCADKLLDLTEMEEIDGRKKLKLRFDSPIWFLIGHSYELIYKAVLLAAGTAREDLKSNGHDLIELRNAALEPTLVGFEEQVQRDWVASNPQHAGITLEDQLALLNEEFGKAPCLHRYPQSGFVRRPIAGFLTRAALKLSNACQPYCFEAYKAARSEA
ncbi:MAG: hypothetical protein AAFN79_20400 [Pseudomonadota bacterium]